MKKNVEKINKLWYQDGHFNEDQRDFFISLLKDLKPKYILEIGWASGRSASTILNSCNPKNMISIDLNLDYINGARAWSENFDQFENYKIVEGDSNKVLTENFFKENFKKGLDFCFVDGCHTYNCAKLDMENCFPKINEGGVMIVDDYRSGPPNGCSLQDVNNAVEDFAKANNLSFDSWNEKGKGFAIFKK